MVGDNECDGLKKKRIGQSAAKLSLKKVEGSTTRNSILNDIYNRMEKFPRAPEFLFI
jgi:hypothetical protein